jgi:hypothetical protein
MKIHAFTCVALLTAVPALAQELALDLHHGHPIYHEREQEAGVAMALSITPAHGQPASLTALCEELRAAAGLAKENGELRLETVFVVPRKGMAIEGLYLASSASGSEALLRGEEVARSRLDDIVSRAGIPPRVLDETDVEHEIACAPGEPLWSITWSDVRRIGDEQPEAVIDRARQRFLAIHQSVVEHNAGEHLQEAQRAPHGG